MHIIFSNIKVSYAEQQNGHNSRKNKITAAQQEITYKKINQKACSLIEFLFLFIIIMFLLLCNLLLYIHNYFLYETETRNRSKHFVSYLI